MAATSAPWLHFEAVCGNGRVERGEDCDDGNQITEECDYGVDACTVCAADCTEQAGDTDLCGDGVLDDGEGCDDGNDENTDDCLNTCIPARCGDGLINAGVEACDDGNDVDTDACTNACTLARCGDGITGPGEECDDANENALDGCLADCAKPTRVL